MTCPDHLTELELQITLTKNKYRYNHNYIHIDDLDYWDDAYNEFLQGLYEKVNINPNSKIVFLDNNTIIKIKKISSKVQRYYINDIKPFINEIEFIIDINIKFFDVIMKFRGINIYYDNSNEFVCGFIYNKYMNFIEFARQYNEIFIYKSLNSFITTISEKQEYICGDIKVDNLLFDKINNKLILSDYDKDFCAQDINYNYKYYKNVLILFYHISLSVFNFNNRTKLNYLKYINTDNIKYNNIINDYVYLLLNSFILFYRTTSIRYYRQLADKYPFIYQLCIYMTTFIIFETKLNNNENLYQILRNDFEINFNPRKFDHNKISEKLLFKSIEKKFYYCFLFLVNNCYNNDKIEYIMNIFKYDTWIEIFNNKINILTNKDPNSQYNSNNNYEKKKTFWDILNWFNYNPLQQCMNGSCMNKYIKYKNKYNLLKILIKKNI